jgi:hypothetical protein
MEVSALIVALGGPAALGRKLGVTTQAVSNWNVTGKVPPNHEVRVWRLASEAGLAWAPPGAEGLALVPRAAMPQPSEAAA